MSTGNTGACEYEQLRIRNIERNNARLRALGLISALEEKRSNATAQGHMFKENAPEEQDDGSNGDWTESPSNKRRREPTCKKASRKSRRLEGKDPGGEKLVAIDHKWLNTSVEKEESVRECREARLCAARVVAEAGAEQASRENPTATYGHCLMRVQTMSEKALGNRIKIIERAAGKHCVVKMAIFKSCLQDENMWNLAKLAADALERLKALQPAPDE